MMAITTSSSINVNPRLRRIMSPLGHESVANGVPTVCSTAFSRAARDLPPEGGTTSPLTGEGSAIDGQNLSAKRSFERDDPKRSLGSSRGVRGGSSAARVLLFFLHRRARVMLDDAVSQESPQ